MRVIYPIKGNLSRILKSNPLEASNPFEGCLHEVGITTKLRLIEAGTFTKLHLIEVGTVTKLRHTEIKKAGTMR